MIAQQVLDFAGMDEVWFLPNYGQIPPKPVAAVADRLAMVSLFRLDHTKVSTLEIDNTLDGDTIHLLPFLPQEHEFHFIIGSDQLPTLHLWGEWQTLLRTLPFLIFPRYGFPNEPLYENMRVVTSELLISSNLSSTKIRRRVHEGLSIDRFVPKEIAAYIEEHKLYR